jgi:hypothetical protein
MAGAFTHFVICDQAKSKKKVLGVELWQLLNKYYQFVTADATFPPYHRFEWTLHGGKSGGRAYR